LSDPQPPAVPVVSGPGTAGARIARGISDVFSPPLMSAVLIALAAVLAGRRGEAGAWRWAVVEIALGVLLPLAHLTWLVHRGHVLDIHLPLRAERIRPFILTGAGTALTLGLAVLLDAPGIMSRVFAAILVQTMLLFAVTLRWQISVHSATAASLAALVGRLAGATAATAALVVLAAVVGWARVRLARHTPAQVAAGLALGAAVMWLALAAG